MSLPTAGAAESSMRRPRLVDDVTARIRDMIINGALRPGQQLLQTTLAEQLGVSRTPLREAFRVLESEGLIRISNRNRTVEVVQISGEELQEMYELREVVDGLAARLAAERGVDEETRAELERLVGEMSASGRSYDSARRAAAHLAFHALIAEMSGNPYVESFAPMIRASNAALYFPTPTDPHAEFLDGSRDATELRTVMGRSDSEHDEIAKAIIAGDPVRAEQAAREHVRHTMATLPELSQWQATMGRTRPAAPAH